jgi:hypothetical protein
MLKSELSLFSHDYAILLLFNFITMIKYIYLLAVIFLFSDLNAQEGRHFSNFNFGLTIDPVKLNLYDPCELLTVDRVGSTLQVLPENIMVKPVGNMGDVKAKSCFYKWEDADMPNTGMLLKLMTNPVYDDSPDFLLMTLNSKAQNGEFVPGQKEKVKYKEAYIGKVKVVYSTQNVYWNIGNNYQFFMAFNLPKITEEQMLKFCHDLIPHINNQMIFKLLE